MKYDEYPSHYREVFEKAHDGEVVVLDFSTHGKAKAFRAELYAYRYRVRDALPDSRELYNMVMAVEMCIKFKTLTIRRKKSEVMEKLNAAISKT